MKRYSLIGLLTVLVAVTVWAAIIEVPEAPARMTAVVVGGGGGGGGGAATGYYDPNADIENTTPYWKVYNTGSNETLYAVIDDSVRSPDAALCTTDTEIVQANFEATTYVMALEDITGSLTTVRVWVYGVEPDGEADGILTVNVSLDGSTWQTAQDLNLPNGSAGWVSKDFSVSAAGAADLRVRLIRTDPGAYSNIRVCAVYVEANP